MNEAKAINILHISDFTSESLMHSDCLISLVESTVEIKAVIELDSVHSHERVRRHPCGIQTVMGPDIPHIHKLYFLKVKK
jgi:hypothetical protein